MHFIHFGCKVNQYETNGMIQKFKEKEYEIVDFEEIADIYIINTCTVTSMADKKSRQFIRQAKKKNKNAIVVACGCYVKVEKDILEKIPEITLCIDNDNKKEIVNIVEAYLENQKIDKICDDKEFNDFGNVTYTENCRAVIKVQDGCNMFCSYCIIPYARGRIRSRKPENVIEEIEKISKEGIKEVVITGIHVASYGKDFETQYDLIDLLSDINKISGIERIRIGSLEPKLLTEENIERIFKIEKLAHHFHLSLQSGCDETLKRMNRKYNIEEFEQIVINLRKKFKDAILTTDIIVGFPGENEIEFNKTYNFLEKIKFYKMHIFKYSVREGTIAEKMENQVSPEIKEERSNKLLKLSDKNEEEYLNSYIGKKVNVLIEEKKNEFYQGHTANFLMVKTNSNIDISNKIVEINVEKRVGLELIGKNVTIL